MIKKFNELYGGEDIDRSDWPNAPIISDKIKSDREKLALINNLYLDLESNRISQEEFVSGVKNTLGISDGNFQGSIKV